MIEIIELNILFDVISKALIEDLQIDSKRYHFINE